MKGKYLVIGLMLLWCSAAVNCQASGVVGPKAEDIYSSILYKSFTLNTLTYPYSQEEERWIVLQTHPHITDKNFNHRKFHKKSLQHFMDAGWRPYLIPNSYNEDLNTLGLDEVVLGSGLAVYRDIQPTPKHQGDFQIITDRYLGLEGDVIITFEDRKNFTFMATMPIYGDSPMWNTFKYRGEPIDKFIRKKIVERLENKLKEVHNYE